MPEPLDNAPNAESIASTEETTVDETTAGTEDTQPSSEHVPLKKYMDEKRDRKAAEAEAEQLRNDIAKLKSNLPVLTVKGVNEEVLRLAKEYDADENFIAKIVSAATTASKEEIRAELEKEYAPKINKIEQDNLRKETEAKFISLYDKAIATMPEYATVVNKDVIKALVFNPANSKKTIVDIIEEAYGNAVNQGRRTIETGSAGREPEKPDFNRGSKEDFEKINSNPALKQEWVKKTEEDLRNYL